MICVNETRLKYPKGETVWTSYIGKSGNLAYIITAKQQRDSYYLYELGEGGFTKLGKGKTPTELERKYDVVSQLQQK